MCEDRYKPVLRALDILEMVGATLKGLSLQDIRRNRMEIIDAGSIHRMLHVLVKRKYLTKMEHPVRYFLGPAMEAVNQKSTLIELRKRITPLMISLCRLSGMKIVYQQFIAGAGFVIFRVNPTAYLHVKSTGYVTEPYGTPVIFQAYMTPEEQDEFWAAHPMDKLDRKTWGGFENLRKYLKLAAKQRLAVIAPQHGQPFRASGPVFDSSGQIIAAISAIQDKPADHKKTSFEDDITPQQAKTAAQMIHRAALELSEHKPPEEFRADMDSSLPYVSVDCP